MYKIRTTTILLVCTLNLDIEKDDKYKLEDKPEWYSINENFQIENGLNKNALGWGYYKVDIEKDGWNKLYIEMNSDMNSGNASLYYAGAGFLEGYLTWSTTYNYSVAWIANDIVGQVDSNLLNEFMLTNYKWMTNNFGPSSSSSLYDQQVYNVIQQFEGFAKGYQAGADSDKQLDFDTLLLLQLAGDLDDIIGYLQYESAPNKTEYISRTMTLEQVERLMATKGRCSALVRVPPDFSELYISHTTWGSYFTAGYRIFKRVIIPDPSVPGTEVVFASYAGVLTSDDDFFQIPTTQLVSIETTNNVLNTSLYQYVTANSLMYWVRSLVANRLSNTGQEWTENFIQYNSGTYNNQWMIVDYKLFTPFEILKPNTLWIIEQIPGDYTSQDMTSYLALGYWPSYNRPYFPDLYNALGYNYYEQLYGDVFTYELNPRAKIFRRDSNQVYSLSDMQSIMTRNNYKTDPFSQGYPGNAISARYDLGSGPNEPFGWSYIGPHGGIDSKISSYAMMQQNLISSISGMTVTPDCQPFKWSDWDIGHSNNTQVHIGSPNTFNFNWITIDIKDK
ncbi:phospholipase B-like protein [Heterostelium album PN500]|uniref:Phospholipase B-like n=1 Tax=Heterostelium pallidum (strain ATCC 26659 / Pp 5 / PN500) TaxID=670386 RepID=D3B0H2_HETP5|nr:phospholipase B-like protein [Heterostelium album PN500]EFA84796.1 phospholipase B-like protein [Heterostelium album PN500]|eukprot:XP_020436907.1 phospholipase B-like protein [Heterostelium album PN500]